MKASIAVRAHLTPTSASSRYSKARPAFAKFSIWHRQAAELLQTYREQGYFAPVYVDSFELFLVLTGTEWPERYDSPIVGLFLLICDLAINPTRGFPLDIEFFEDFIRDVDP
ncbi:MAG: hypothetical protein E5X90_23505, partial [Mesorhizobium sp.]